MVERGQMHREMIGDSQWSSWCAPLFRISDACFPFFRRLGLLGQDGDSKGEEDWLWWCAWSKSTNPNQKERKKQLARREMDNRRGIFLLKKTPVRNL